MKIGFLKYLLNRSDRNKRMMVSLAGTAKNQFYYQSESRKHTFKRNQRKARSSQGRRKMKTNAR